MGETISLDDYTTLPGVRAVRERPLGSLPPPGPGHLRPGT